MAIDYNSRYADNAVVPLADGVGKARPTIIVSPPSSEKRISYSTYTWQDDDYIEYLAWSAYGDEKAWWLIADANPEILFWRDLPRGTEVRVPGV
jgi:hypothetical protein